LPGSRQVPFVFRHLSIGISCGSIVEKIPDLWERLQHPQAILSFWLLLADQL
jgi:hypothetical protein